MAQDVQIIAGNPSMSKIFVDNSADGQWSGNVALDSISAQSIGILIPNSTLTYVQPQYAGGGMAWRLQNAQSLFVSSWGFGALAGQQSKQYLSRPVRVNPNDILTTFPVADAAPGSSAVLAWVTTSMATELFYLAASADGTDTQMLTAVNGQTIGDAFFNSTLQSISVQCQDGSILNNLSIVDNAGGVVMTVAGNGRGVTTASRSNYVNGECMGLSVPIGKGFKFQVNVTSA
jgi:hypothetical protein